VVKGGKRLPADGKLVSTPTDHPYIRARDIRDGRITFDDPVFVTDDDFGRIARYTVDAGDICITIVGANVGDVGVVPPTLHKASLTENAVKLVHLRPEVCCAFLGTALASPAAKAQMQSAAAGAAQPKLGIYKVQEVLVPLPPLPAQRRIASILSAYDDLIENCERRIRLLDEMARGLYREWFLLFRYPGHEKTPLVDSPLGRIPKGWGASPIADLIDAHIGGGWGSETIDEEYTEPGWVIRGTDIPGARHGQVSSIPHRFHALSNIRSRVLAPLDIVFETSGGSKGQPVGRALLITRDLLEALGGACICASFCKKVRSRTDAFGPYLLYLSFLEGYTSGEISTYQVQSTGISNFKWVDYIGAVQRAVPPPRLQVRFRELVEPLFSIQAKLGREASNLRATRDLLLPRLLSGQLSVDDAA
jgi:type I restriction enzyme S subunit